MASTRTAPASRPALADLQQFAEREGHSRVPRSHVEDGFRLGQWVHNQRSAYAAGQLEPERVKRLESVRGWVWDPMAAAWERGCAFLLQFARREGHTRVRQSHVEDGFRLGNWVNQQRVRYRAGKLEPERVKRLEEVSGWAWEGQAAVWEQVWEQRWVALRKFVSREGHSRVFHSHVEGGFQLGRWVSHQQEAYRAGRLASERVRRLESLPGWSWSRRGNERRRQQSPRSRRRRLLALLSLLWGAGVLILRRRFHLPS